MALRTAPGRNPFELPQVALARLDERVGQAIAYARREVGPAFAAVTVPLPPELDVTAVVLAARLPTDRYFCLEQPDRGAFALAALGEAANVEASGRDRFSQAAHRSRSLSRRVFAGDPADDPAAPSGAGPAWMGGFAFAADGGGSPEWSSFDPVRLSLPELALIRHKGEARLTVCVRVDPDDDGGSPIERVGRRLASLAPSPMPLLDPSPVERARVASAAPPAHYEEAVRQAVERIRSGELEKVVLAREVRVHSPGPVDPAPVLGALREVFPACFCFCVGTPEGAFLGASPELLLRREGARAQTVALAGTARRSADPAVDDHLG
ncbi:MAG TPA: chorismate-binding protein, partial [Thermoleophilaceae bacterium]|nr:chorismate-binding protein [Thermoleophilaceae bacterium]